MQSGGEGLCKGDRGGGGAATCSSAMPDPEVLADDGSPQRGGAAAGPPRGIEPRPPLAVVPAGGPSRRVKTAVECQRTTCSAIVRNIDMPSRMRMARSGKTQSLSACMSAPSSGRGLERSVEHHASRRSTLESRRSTIVWRRFDHSPTFLTEKRAQSVRWAGPGFLHRTILL